MADLPYIQEAQEVKITGQDATGNTVNYVGADANGNLTVKDYADGPVTAGTAASASTLIGSQYNTSLPTLTTGQQVAIQSDSSGRIITAPNGPDTDRIGTGTITAINTGVAANTQGCSTINFYVSGTFVATYIFQGTTDGINWIGLNAYSYNSTTIVTNSSLSAQEYAISCGAFQQVRVFALAFTSGTITVAYDASEGIGGSVSVNNTIAANLQTVATQGPAGASAWLTTDAADGSVSPGTAAGKSMLGGGIYNSTPPTLTTGQQASLQLDVAGNLDVNLQTALPKGNNYVGKVNYQGAGTIDEFGAVVTSNRINQVEAHFFDNSYLQSLNINVPYTFTIPSSSVTAGAVYTVSAITNPTTTYTFYVTTTIAASTTLTTTGNGTPAGTGTLVLVSGTGPATIAYTAVASTGAGTVTTSAGAGVIASGTATTAYIEAQSKSTIKYSVGHEVYAMGTLQFTTPTSTATFQRWGTYNSSDGFYIGYGSGVLTSSNGTTFGVGLRKTGVDTFIAKTSWNIDTLTGTTGSLFTRLGVPEAIILTDENIFRIRYGWLGVGTISFEVLSPDGIWVTFHQILYPNSSTGVHIQTPNLPVTYEVSKTAADATNLILTTGATTIGTTQVNPTSIFDFSNTNLAAGASYTTQWFDSVAQGTGLAYSVLADQNISYAVQYSPDQIFIKNMSTGAIPANLNFNSQDSFQARYARVTYTNTSASATTILFLSTVQNSTYDNNSVITVDVTGQTLVLATKNSQPTIGGENIVPAYVPVTQTHNAGRNMSNLFMATQIVTTATDTLMSLTGYKSGAAVTATTTPAVVTTGKTLRITSIAITYIAVATVGTAKFTLRANTAGVVAITSPVVAQWSAGEFSTSGTPAGVANTVSIPIPEGMEFAAGTGIGISMQGFGATGTAAAVGYGLCTIYGYEY